MPGSKTFTSTKNLEFLESSLMEEYQKLQHQPRLKRAFSGVVEVIKIVASAILSAFFALKTDLSKLFSQTNLEYLIEDIVILGIKICCVFFLGYILVSFVLYLLSFLLDAILNSRRWKSRRENAKQIFYKITVNLIMLAVSFEHKCYAYHEQEKKFPCGPAKNAWLDLEIEYFLQAITYFQFAEQRLIDLIPEKMHLKCKERVNRQYIDYIGFGNIIAHIEIALQSMKRLREFFSNIVTGEEDFKTLRERINECEYTYPINKQGEFLDELITEYEKHLKLVNERKEEN